MQMSLQQRIHGHELAQGIHVRWPEEGGGGGPRLPGTHSFSIHVMRLGEELRWVLARWMHACFLSLLNVASDHAIYVSSCRYFFFASSFFLFYDSNSKGKAPQDFYFYCNIVHIDFLRPRLCAHRHSNEPKEHLPLPWTHAMGDL